MVSEEIKNRKGARKIQNIPANVLKLLNEGAIQTANLTEWLAIDQIQLIKHTFPSLDLENSLNNIIPAIRQQKKISTMGTIKVIGRELYEFSQQTNSLARNFDVLSKQEPDLLRCYAAYLIALDDKLSISEKLERSRDIVADKHFGVREVAWMALRPEIDKNLAESISILSKWTKDSDENIRRFTTESTRPRGVWCKHIEQLKEKPELALPILDMLKSDHSKYVRDSVGNWLNDASKSRPEFVRALCERWKTESQTAETEKIIKRGLRTIDK